MLSGEQRYPKPYTNIIVSAQGWCHSSTILRPAQIRCFLSAASYCAWYIPKGPRITPSADAFYYMRHKSCATIWIWVLYVFLAKGRWAHTVFWHIPKGPRITPSADAFYYMRHKSRATIWTGVLYLFLAKCQYGCILVYSKGATYNPFSRYVLRHEAQESCYDMNTGAVLMGGQTSAGPYCISYVPKGRSITPLFQQMRSTIWGTRVLLRYE